MKNGILLKKINHVILNWKSFRPNPILGKKRFYLRKTESIQQRLKLPNAFYFSYIVINL